MHKPLHFALLIASLYCSSATHAAPFTISAQPLDSALTTFARQAGIQILFNPEETRGLSAPALDGDFSSAEGLQKLLSGSGLQASPSGNGSYIVQRSSVPQLPPKTLPALVVSADRETSYKPEKITVASKLPLSPRDIPYSVSVLSRSQMDDQNMVTLWDAMTQMTGTQAISNTSDHGQYHARGGAMNVQYDGTPSGYPLSGYQQFDLAMYERIEVQRGPAGVLQGSGAFSGTVNLVRKAPKADFGGHVQATQGSWDNTRLETDVTGPLSADGRIRGRIVAAGNDKDSFVNRNHNEKWLGYGIVEADLLPSTTLRLSLAAQESRTRVGYGGLPTYTDGRLIDLPRSFSPDPDWNRYTWKHQEVVGELEHRFSAGWRAKFRASNRETSSFFKDGYLTTGIDPLTMTGNYTRRKADWDYTARDVDVNVGGPFELFGRSHQLLLGMNYSAYLAQGKTVSSLHVASLRVNNVRFNDPPEVPDFNEAYRTGSKNRTVQRGVYGQVQLKLLDPLTLVLGGRYSDYDNESRTVAPDPAPTAWGRGAREKHVFTPSAGLVFDASRNVSLYASYADIFVPQTAKQADGSVLEPRVGKQYEIGAKGEFFDRKLLATVAVFQIKDTNRSFADPANPGFFLPLGEVESKGWELEVAGSPLRNWDISAGYTRLETEQTKTATAASVGAPISYWYPRHQLKLWSNYRFTSQPLQGFNLGLGVTGMSNIASGVSTPTVKAREQRGYALVNAVLGYRINQTYALSLSVNNLFDRRYFTRVQGLNTYMTYGEPRNWLLNLKAVF
ncbi:MAG: TonB-dependent siderophore receptor [Azonexus sp.]|jgi:outer membrane receptor for ferric coprogen and ferric-rhodotorulic acid|nr:TonB-dependent siderophore receptor [Azonexus sp.]